MVKKIIKYSAIFLSYFLYELLISFIFNKFSIDVKNMDYIKKNVVYFIIDIVYILFLFLIYKKELKDDLKKGNIKVDENITIYMIGLIIMVISNSIIMKITNKELSNNEQIVRTMIDFFPVYMSFSSVIYAPFVEELIFRKTIRKMIDNKYIYIITSGVLFGLIHVISNNTDSNELLMGIPYILMGIDFAYIYVRTNNIYTTMIIHALHNLIMLIVQFIGG